MDVKKHIQSIIDDILANNDISKTFLKVQVLAHILKNDKFTQWFKSEQYGYGENDILPEYRIIKVSINGSVLHDMGYKGSLRYPHINLSTSHIENKALLERLMTYKSIEPLNKIQKMAIAEKGTLIVNLDPPIIGILEKGLERNCYIHQAWQQIQSTDFTNIITQVKSTLLQFVLDLSDSLALNIDLNSSNNKKQIEKFINNIYATNVITGNNSVISANDSTNIGGKENTVIISSEAKQKIETILTEIETLINKDEQADIVDAISSIRDELHNENPRPKFLKTAFNFIKNVGVGVFANKITPLVDSAIEIISKFSLPTA